MQFDPKGPPPAPSSTPPRRIPTMLVWALALLFIFGGLSVGDVALDPEQHLVVVRGEQVSLPLKEFELLHLLLANAGRVLSRDVLIDRVWGSDYVGDTKTLDVHIKRLRTRVETDPATPTRIVTIRGLGYKYDKPR